MRRDVCSKCCALLIAGLFGYLVGGCATGHSGRWIPPQEVFGFSSTREITNKFARYDVVTPHGMRTQELQTTRARFFFVTRIPYSSSNVLTTYCFEQTDPDFWQLRALLIFARVKSVHLEFVTDCDAVNVVSDGKTLFRVVSTASERQQRP